MQLQPGARYLNGEQVRASARLPSLKEPGWEVVMATDGWFLTPIKASLPPALIAASQGQPEQRLLHPRGTGRAAYLPLCISATCLWPCVTNTWHFLVDRKGLQESGAVWGKPHDLASLTHSMARGT